MIVIIFMYLILNKRFVGVKTFLLNKYPALYTAFQNSEQQLTCATFSCLAPHADWISTLVKRPWNQRNAFTLMRPRCSFRMTEIKTSENVN